MYMDASGVAFGSLDGAAVVLMDAGSVSSASIAQAIDTRKAQVRTVVCTWGGGGIFVHGCTRMCNRRTQMLPPVCSTAMRRQQSAKMEALEFQRPRHEMCGRHPRGNYALRSQWGLKQPRQGY